MIGTGAVWLGSNPGYKEFELTNLFESARPRLVITAPELLPTVHAVTRDFDIPDAKVFVLSEPQNAPEGAKSWRDLLQRGEDDWIRFDNERLAKETPACMVTTSGTTGLPKLAVLSHYSWVAFNSVVDDPVPKPYEIKR